MLTLWCLSATSIDNQSPPKPTRGHRSASPDCRRGVRRAPPMRPRVERAAGYFSLNSAESDDPSSVRTVTSQHVPGRFGESQRTVRWPPEASTFGWFFFLGGGDPPGALVAQLTWSSSTLATRSGELSFVGPANTSNRSWAVLPAFSALTASISIGLLKPSSVHDATEAVSRPLPGVSATAS